ncbi:MAG: hypothetical protein HY326_06715 [Chloroflexi bacterium]|nr:hypothetical protein [Chloroflexota bacterium]
MANDLENSIRSAAEKISQYISDAFTMSVSTRFFEVGVDGVDALDAEKGKPVAFTQISPDGDYTSIIPMRKNAAGQLDVDQGLFDIHQENVTAAMEYRARILETLVDILQSRIK